MIIAETKKTLNPLHMKQYNFRNSTTGLSRTLFYSKSKKVLLIHFKPTLHYYAPRKQKAFDFLMFSVDICGFKWNIGCKWVK